MQGTKKSKDFDFNDYSTPIDPVFYKKHEKLAATIANEMSAHQEDVDVEDSSCVTRVEERPQEPRTTPSDKYVPPFRRAHGTVAPAEPSPSTPSSPLLVASILVTPIVKFKFNPNARSFALDPFAPEYVPLVEPEDTNPPSVREVVQVPQIITTSAPQQQHNRFPQPAFVQPQETFQAQVKMSPALLPPPHESPQSPLLQHNFLGQSRFPQMDALSQYQSMQQSQLQSQLQLQAQFQAQMQPQIPQFQQQQFLPQQFQVQSFQQSPHYQVPQSPHFQVPQSPQFQAQMYPSPQFQSQQAPFQASQLQLQYPAQPQFRQPPDQNAAHQRFPNGASSLPMQPPYRQILPRPQGGFGANSRSFSPQNGN
jgi:hypothetical protein